MDGIFEIQVCPKCAGNNEYINVFRLNAGHLEQCFNSGADSTLG